MFCPLHAKLRIVSNLLKYFLKTRSSIEEVETKLRSLPGNSNFKFRQKEASIEDENQFDQSDVEVPFLNGSQCNLLLKEFPRLFSLSQAVRDIWRLVQYLFQNWIDASEKKVSAQRFSDLETALKRLSQLLKRAYPGQMFGYYFHIIICHLPDVLQKYGSVSQFSNQGLF